VFLSSEKEVVACCSIPFDVCVSTAKMTKWKLVSERDKYGVGECFSPVEINPHELMRSCPMAFDVFLVGHLSVTLSHCAERPK
jgi:hypothetical protein